MTKPLSHTMVEIYDRAEGSSEADRPREKNSTQKTSTLQAVRVPVEHGGPAGETGVVAAVVAHAEGVEDNEAQDASRTTAETRASRDTQTAPRAPSILIVEDSTELAEIIEATLQRINMVTVHETHGGRALNRFNDMRPDVVLLDIALPDMTGWQVLDYIKEKKGSSSMPVVIVITAYGDPANRLVGKLQNVNSYLVKPFTADEVEQVVVSALGGAGR